MPRTARCRRGRFAFTLHELLIALTVAAILASVALRPVARWQRRAVAHATASTLRADLARARVLGVLRGETVTVVLDTIQDGWWGEAKDGTVLFERRLDPGLSLTSTAHRGRIPFTSRGTSNLYSTTWIGIPDDPDARWHGARVSPTGAVEPR